jgi:hypothetical protein
MLDYGGQRRESQGRLVAWQVQVQFFLEQALWFLRRHS